MLGLIIWLIRFFFEAVGDYQLWKFKKKAGNKGKIMTKGLWRFTRHPNYFGETAIWLGIFMIALSMKSGWTAIVSPLMITFLLLRVLGITMLEKKILVIRSLRNMQKRQTLFSPGFPRNYKFFVSPNKEKECSNEYYSLFFGLAFIFCLHKLDRRYLAFGNFQEGIF